MKRTILKPGSLDSTIAAHFHVTRVSSFETLVNIVKRSRTSVSSEPSRESCGIQDDTSETCHDGRSQYYSRMDDDFLRYLIRKMCWLIFLLRGSSEPTSLRQAYFSNQAELRSPVSGRISPGVRVFENPLALRMKSLSDPAKLKACVLFTSRLAFSFSRRGFIFSLMDGRLEVHSFCTGVCQQRTSKVTPIRRISFSDCGHFSRAMRAFRAQAVVVAFFSYVLV